MPSRWRWMILILAGPVLTALVLGGQLASLDNRPPAETGVVPLPSSKDVDDLRRSRGEMPPVRKQDDPGSQLVGTWRSGVVNSEDGPMTMEFTFSKDGKVQVTIVPQGRERDRIQLTGKYRASQDGILAIEGKDWKPDDARSFRIEKGILFLKADDDPEIALTRVDD
jgi:hypothetical protein